MNRSMEYLNKLLKDDDTVVLGVSGGPDSMCLLSLLLRVREQVNIKIVVCHVNHMVRREALEEEAFVRKFALDNKCFFELKTLDKVAYIRFASVYLSFDDINQFTKEIENLKD